MHLFCVSCISISSIETKTYFIFPVYPLSPPFCLGLKHCQAQSPRSLFIFSAFFYKYSHFLFQMHVVPVTRRQRRWNASLSCNASLFHFPWLSLSHLFLRHADTIADPAQTGYCTTFHCSSVRSCVTGVTSQLFSIIWWFRAWKPCIFWQHVILARSVHEPNSN